MADDAIGQIIDAFAVQISNYAALLPADTPLKSDVIVSDRSPEEAISNAELPCTVIYLEAWSFDPAPEQGQTRHTALVNFERLETSANVGIIGRANREAIAHIIAALHADRTLGGLLEDIQENDIAPPSDNGRSIGGASLQVGITFYTPRGDHFTIVS